MFNIQGGELIFLLLIALVILGPEKLPDAVRRFGRTYSEFKKFSAGFQGELRQALDEPMRELRETADAVRVAANFDFDAADDGADSTDAGGATDSSDPARSERERGKARRAEAGAIRPRQKAKRDTALNFGDTTTRRASRTTGAEAAGDEPTGDETTRDEPTGDVVDAAGEEAAG